MQKHLQAKHFLSLKAKESSIWSCGWSVDLTHGLTNVIWYSNKVTQDLIDNIQGIHAADQKIDALCAATMHLAQSSKFIKSTDDCRLLAEKTSLFWDEYYAHTARLLWQVSTTPIALIWGQAGVEALKNRNPKSNFCVSGLTNKVIWDNLRLSRNDHRALQDVMFDESCALKQLIEPLHQSYFYHRKSIIDGLERYYKFQDDQIFLATPYLCGDYLEILNKASHVILKLLENFNDSLAPLTFRLLRYSDAIVPPGNWSGTPRIVPDFAMPVRAAKP